MQRQEAAAVKTGAPWPDLDEAEARVLRMQTKLHQWATDDPGRRFDDLYNLVCDPAFLDVAWARVRGNRGARSAGVDGVAPCSVVFGQVLLEGLRADLKARRFEPLPVRDTQLSFEALDALRQRRLGRVQPLGRPPEMELLGHNREVAQMLCQIDQATIAIRLSTLASDRSWTSAIVPVVLPGIDMVARGRTVDARSSGRHRAVPLAWAAGGGVVRCAAAGCGEGNDDSSSAHAGSGSATASIAAPTADEPRCNTGALERATLRCLHGGRGRPAGFGCRLARRGSSAEEMRAVTRLDHRAAEAGLAVVFPQALDGGWGDDTFSSSARPGGDEDLVFLAALVHDLQADPRIDDGPIRVAGFSNGASMALRYAAERPDDVRAVVSVAGQLPRDPLIRPSGRVPLLAVHGTADPLRPYGTWIPETPGRRPGDPTPTLPTPDTVAAFLAVGGGPIDHEVPEEIDSDPGDGTRVRTERWIDGDSTVAILRAILDGGHTWPSSNGQFNGGENFGATSREIDASADAIAFLRDPDEAGRSFGQ